MTARSSLTVVLAAGEGTRMRSALPKVLPPAFKAAAHYRRAAIAVQRKDFAAAELAVGNLFVEHHNDPLASAGRLLLGEKGVGR